MKTAAPSVACALVDEKSYPFKKTVTLSGDGAEYYLSSKNHGRRVFRPYEIRLVRRAVQK
ncbi:MAG: hypothetical protein L6V85_09625 [Clostridiales bacterium]|nr:MAG: hypothetical protein L6V85_09625 [Clostridiales bacterium]